MFFTISGSWTRRARTATAVSLLGCSGAACGASPSPKPLSAEAVITSKGGADISNRPAPPPAGVIAVGRARDYRQWVKLEQASPVIAFLKKKLVEEEGDALLEDWDLNQPVEFVATFDRNFRRTPDKPEPQPKPEKEPGEGEEDGDEVEEATPSAPADEAEDHFFAAFSLPLTRYAPDSYVKLGFKRWTADAYERGKCLVTRALGSAKARLICGDHPDVTHHLYDYLARGLPLEPLSPAPLFVELRAQPLKELWAPARDAGLSSLQPLAETAGNTSRLAQELTRSVVKEVDAWVASADTVRFVAGPNERDEFEGSVTLALRAPEPWLVQSSLAGAAKVNGAPSAFSNLPKEVGWAWYGYGMPAERTAVLQSALVNLAKTAWQEYGATALDAGKLTAAETKAVDRLASGLISVLDSPCVRAEQTVFANLPADPSEISAYATPKRVKLVKQPQPPPVVPFDVIARATLGQYLVAVPNTASCTQFSQQWVDLLTTALQALPAKEKKKLPLSISVRKNVKLEGLPPATVTRISLPKQAVADLMKELKSDGTGKRYYNFKSADSPLSRWGAPKGPMTVSLIVVPSADAAGSDWFGFGLDEKQLTQALVQATHPVPGQTLASRVELAPFIAKNPTSLAFQSFESYSNLMALMGGQELSSTLIALQNFFHGTTIVATKSIKLRGNVAEANSSYYLSKEGLAALRQILSLDIEHLLELAKSINPEKTPIESGSKVK